MKVNSNRFKARLRLIRKKLKVRFSKKSPLNLNLASKREQYRHAAVLLTILGVSLVFYKYSAHVEKSPVIQTELQFDGIFGESFSQDSDEAHLKWV